MTNKAVGVSGALDGIIGLWAPSANHGEFHSNQTERLFASCSAKANKLLFQGTMTIEWVYRVVVSPMRRAARLAESWSRVLGGQPMTFGVAHMKPRRCNPSMTTTNCKRRSECTAKVCKTPKLEFEANQLQSKTLTHSTVRNKIYAAQKDSKVYTSIRTYIHTDRQTRILCTGTRMARSVFISQLS